MHTSQQNATATIAVVHSSALLRSGLTSILGNIAGTQILGAPNLGQLVATLPEDAHLDTVILNMDSFSDQFSKLREFHQQFPDVHIVTLASEYDAEQLFYLFQIGVHGALLDDVSQTTIELALSMINEGEKVYPSNLANVVMERFQYMSPMHGLDHIHEDIELSPRELEILECIARGDSNKRIALRLNISEATVKVHVKSILRKIKADNRTQAAIWALRSRPPFGGSADAPGTGTGTGPTLPV